MAVVTTRSSTETPLGAGLLYVAATGTAEPTTSADLAAASLPSAWREIGYTEDGSVWKYDVKSEDIEVAEELDPIGSAITSRTGTVEFKMKQSSRRNLVAALNSGAASANDGTTVEPPDPSAMVRVMLLHVSNDASAVRGVLFRQCFNVGGIEVDWSKAPKTPLLPVMFKLEKPTSKTPWIAFPNANGLVA
ncbi:MAG: hypothetical protein KA758_17755 [Acidimicrobiales bacterium]|nr:hypothetical protein [Acidimicrobiales bacterium]